MRINLYKIEDIQGLKNHLGYNYVKATSTRQIGDYEVCFYYKIDDEKEIKWINIFKEFEVDENPTQQGYRGVLLFSKMNNYYGIPFGYGGFLLQKFCVKEFGVSIGRKIKLRKLKRKGSTQNKSVGRKGTAITYQNTKGLDIQPGEIITQLSFEPEEKERFGKRIDLGKSFKINKSIGLNEELTDLIDYISELENDDVIINKIPYLIKVTDDEDIDELDKLMFHEIVASKENELDLSSNEMNVIGSSIYFEDQFTIALRYTGFSEKVVENLTISEILEYCSSNNIPVEDMIYNGKIVYRGDDDKSLFSDRIYNYLNFDINIKMAVLFEGKWYKYNEDFVDIIHRKLLRINFVYEDKYNGLKSRANNSGINGLYTEDRINKYLELEYGMKNIDRNLYIIDYESALSDNKFRVELGDLIINDTEFCALKHGDYKSFTYCMEQSELAGEVINRDLREVKSIYGVNFINTLSCWFLLNRNIPIAEDGSVDILSINSIMFKRKLVQWFDKVTSLGFNSLARINKL